MQSIHVRDQFDQSKSNSITCDNIVITHILENKHGLEDTLIGDTRIIDDLFANSNESIDNEMNTADDDIFTDLFLD